MNATVIGKDYDPNNYVYQFVEENCHPDTKGSYQILLPVTSIVALYLVFVLQVGPRFMKNRKPYDLKHVMKIYNYINIIVNLVMCTACMYFSRGMYEFWGCQPSTAPDWLRLMGKTRGVVVVTLLLINLIYSVKNTHSAGELYLTLKVFDLADTVFFVLRKKWQQVTPLHVIHHSIMPFTAWTALKFAPVTSAGTVVTLNTLVHTVMYTYYHLASLGKDVWWKKYITVMQLIQFYICLVHAVHTFFIPNCDFPRWLASLQAAESIFFIITFTRFYFHSYQRKKVE